ncbi:hypothetical protein [Azospirillum sp. ST 5-10]|uniref:hypothetical protein n=1 Tax=unclassified Azospirillum TaxID=2630922 RepID=UPI003F49BD5A
MAKPMGNGRDRLARALLAAAAAVSAANTAILFLANLWDTTGRLFSGANGVGTSAYGLPLLLSLVVTLLLGLGLYLLRR